MDTLRLNPHSESDLDTAAGILRSGGLVVIPTETVYGLAANALDETAVAKIFAAKGRPSTNPLIVHFADVEQAQTLTTDWTPAAQRLAKAFWPGPLTIVVPRAQIVPHLVTAGGDTVALRCPDHPTALEILRRAGVPLAAPSANLSTRVSPTTAQDALRQMDGLVDAVVMGEDCVVGLESTVVDATCKPIRILRPGGISATRIADVLRYMPLMGPVTAGLARSPGQMERHYAPDAKLVMCRAEDAESEVRSRCEAGTRTAWLRFGEGAEIVNALVVAMPVRASEYGAVLYLTLNQLDSEGIEVIMVDLPPQNPEWAAVNDRLRRASAPG